MAGSTLRLPQISLLLLFILKTSVVLSTGSGSPVILTTSDDEVLPKLFLQNRNNNNPTSGTCQTGYVCERVVSASTLYTMILPPTSGVLYVLSNSYQTAMTLSYSSTSTSSLITTELALWPYYGQSLLIDTPSNYSYSLVVSQDLIQEYQNQIRFLVINNSTDTTTTVTAKMTFASAASSSSGSSSSSSSSYSSSSGSSSSSSSSSSSTSDGGVSLMNIILPIAGALFSIFLIGICCHFRKKQQEQQRVMANHRARARRARGQEDGEEVEDLEDLLTVGNIQERFPKAEFEHFKSSFPQTTCSVCLEEFQPRVGCRQLYCEHMFHSECIRLWLANQIRKGYAFCPNCNKDMMRKPPEVPQAVIQVKVQPRAIPGH